VFDTICSCLNSYFPPPLGQKNKNKNRACSFWLFLLNMEQVLLRDPLDEDVIPVVEELQRRLPPANVFRQSQGDGKDHTGGQLDVEAGEEDGMPH
jgi:hypothetical protein